MEVSPVMQWIIGIVVTVLTFGFQYTRTIGARKERAKTANNSIIKSLYRNLILEERTLTFDEISRLLSAKVIEYRIKEDDLFSEIDFINTIYTKLFEDELIDLERKNLLLSKIDDLITNESKKLDFSSTFLDKKEEYTSQLFLYISSIITGLAVYMAIAQSDVTLAYDWLTLESLILVIMGMVVALYFTRLTIKVRTKEPIDISPTRSRIHERRDLKENVKKKLRSYKFILGGGSRPLQVAGKTYLLDLYAKKNDKQYGFEILGSPRSITRRKLELLGGLSKELKSEDKTIILVIITHGNPEFNKHSKEVLKNWDYIIDSSSLNRLAKI